MRVNLLFDNPGAVRSGYLNIDPFAPTPDTHGRVVGDVNNLDKLVENGEAEEIVAHDILGYFPPQQVDEVLGNWLGKLAHKGILTVACPDVGEAARQFLQNLIRIEDYNVLLHGEQTEGWQLRRSSFTLPLLVGVFTTRGFRVIQKRIQNNFAVVTAQRS